MRRALAILLVAAAAGWGAVEGTVVNRTTGKPQPNATVTLYKLGGAGMEAVESVKSDAQGRFRMDRTPQGPHLLQTAFDGVTYNHMLPAGTPTTALEPEVFNSSSRPGAARVTQHMVLFELEENQLLVNESILFQNDGKLAYNDPENGTLRIFLPEGIQGGARVMATAPKGMPVERAAEKTARTGVYKVDFPIKPGETRFDVSYAVAFSSPGVFAGRALHKEGPVRLVAPPGVSLQGEGLELLGQEPHTQASIYGIKGSEYKVEIGGSGTLRTAQEAEEDNGASIVQILPRVYTNVYWVVGLSLAILMLGLLFEYMRKPATPAPHNPKTNLPRGKRHG